MNKRKYNVVLLPTGMQPRDGDICKKPNGTIAVYQEVGKFDDGIAQYIYITDDSPIVKCEQKVGQYTILKNNAITPHSHLAIIEEVRKISYKTSLGDYPHNHCMVIIATNDPKCIDIPTIDQEGIQAWIDSGAGSEIWLEINNPKKYIAGQIYGTPIVKDNSSVIVAKEDTKLSNNSKIHDVDDMQSAYLQGVIHEREGKRNYKYFDQWYNKEYGK